MNSRRKLSAVSTSLYCGTAVAALAMFYPLAAFAQPATPAAAPETVTVTGTIIKGAGPTGSNLITVDRTAIENSGAVTVSQVLANVPGLNNFGSAGQGAQNSSDPGGASSPTIHSLGNSASNGTLILVDGHRLPYTGIQHNTIDPSAIPVIALQQVQVLPDGASATYGSDAVAGVLNFITRKNYSGMEFDASYGFADRYENFSAGALMGHDWNGGSAELAYEYVSKSEFANGVQPYETARQDLRLGALANPGAFSASLASGGAVANPPAGFLATTPAAGQGTTGPFGATVPYPSIGGNFQGFSCPIATIRSAANATGQPATSLSFLYPYNTAGIVNNNTPGNGVCDENNYGSQLPSENRNTVFFSFKQQLSDNVSFTADFDYSTRLETSIGARGTFGTAVAFGPGNTFCVPAAGQTTCSPTGGLPVAGATTNINAGAPVTGDRAFAAGQINPFYQTGTTGISQLSQQVSYDFTPLLANFPKSMEKTGDTVAFTNLGIDWDLGGDWDYNIGATFGVDYDFDRSTNQLCSSCALLALNGTTNTNGTANSSATSSAIIDPAGLSTVLSETRALTTLNALDVWDPVATNKTSAAVLKQLVSGFSNGTATQGIQDVTTQIGGPLFDLPAGPVRAAIGAEYIHTTDAQLQNNAQGSLAPASVASSTTALFYGRTVWAAYAEVLIPLVSPEMNVPLIQKFTLDMSGRIDNYTSYGFTKNPKVGFTWQIFDGIQGRGSYGTSFTVPAFASGGAGQSGVTSQSAISGGGAPGNPVPFNDTTYNGGAGVAGTFAQSAVSCAAAGSQPVDASGNNVNATSGTGLTAVFPATAVACKVNATNDPGIQYAAGGKPGLKPEVGTTYSAGFDFDFGKLYEPLTGLSGEVTYFQAKYAGLVTSIGLGTSQPGLTFLGPAPTAANPLGGWNIQDPFIVNKLSIGYPLNVSLPGTVYTFFDGRQTNAYNLWSNGLDFGAHYVMDTDSLGTFTAGLNGTEILRATQQNIGQTALIDIKNGKGLSSGRFTDQELTWRGTLGWNMNPYSASLGFNFQSPFLASVSTFPFNQARPNANIPTLPGQQNFEKISALFTVDLNLGYTIPDGWYPGLGGTKISVSISNLLDQNPPYQDSASGMGAGSQLGRLTSISLKKNL